VIDDDLGSGKTILSTSSSRKSPATPEATAANQPLPWSPDPGHALQWSPDHTARTQADLPPAHVQSPPKLERTTNPAAGATLSGLARIAASREVMVGQIVDSLRRAEDAKAASAPAPASPSTTSTTAASHQEPEHRDTVEKWQTIFQGSASKRKAKASPKANVTSSIRKPEATRSTKKQLFEPASPHQETPAPKN
jgi:hypothetical protein